MPTELSPHNARLAQVHELRTPRGRRDAGRFAAEGPTLLEEAARSGLRPAEIYVTADGLGRFDAGRWEATGTPVFIVPERAGNAKTASTPVGVSTSESRAKARSGTTKTEVPSASQRLASNRRTPSGVA